MRNLTALATMVVVVAVAATGTGCEPKYTVVVKTPSQAAADEGSNDDVASVETVESDDQQVDELDFESEMLEQSDDEETELEIEDLDFPLARINCQVACRVTVTQPIGTELVPVKMDQSEGSFEAGGFVELNNYWFSGSIVFQVYPGGTIDLLVSGEVDGLFEANLELLSNEYILKYGCWTFELGDTLCITDKVWVFGTSKSVHFDVIRQHDM